MQVGKSFRDIVDSDCRKTPPVFDGLPTNGAGNHSSHFSAYHCLQYCGNIDMLCSEPHCASDFLDQIVDTLAFGYLQETRRTRRSVNSTYKCTTGARSNWLDALLREVGLPGLGQQMERQHSVPDTRVFMRIRQLLNGSLETLAPDAGANRTALLRLLLSKSARKEPVKSS